MNSSAPDRVLAPTGVVTVTSTVPEPEGEVTAIEVDEMAVMVPAVEPKSTALVPVKPVPVMVTEVPPAGTPATGLSVLIVGAPS